MSGPIRLPQDVGPPANGDTRGIPDLSQMLADVGVYAAMRSHLDDPSTRATGCWGLVAQWPASRAVVESLLGSGQLDDVEDAAGVLCRVGVPIDLMPVVLSAIESLPDSSARDALVEALPANHPRRVPDSRSRDDALRPLELVPLRGAWEPYTEQIGFIGGRFDAVANEFSKWMGKIRSPHELSRHTGPLTALLSLLDPYMFPSKTLVVETRSNWTAVFGNPGAKAATHVLSKTMGLRSLETAFSVDLVERGDVRNYGNVLFEVIDRGQSVRTIQVSRQPSGWEVHFLGAQQPFEQPERYQARIKRDRFDLEMLNRYCAALGIEREKADFYGPRAVLHEERSTGGTRHPQFATAAAWRVACLGIA